MNKFKILMVIVLPLLCLRSSLPSYGYHLQKEPPDSLGILHKIASKERSVRSVEHFLNAYEYDLEMRWVQYGKSYEEAHNKVFVSSPCKIYSRLCHEEYIRLRLDKYTKSLSELNTKDRKSLLVYEKMGDTISAADHMNYDISKKNLTQSKIQKQLLKSMFSQTKSIKWPVHKKPIILTGNIAAMINNYTSYGYVTDSKLINQPILKEFEQLMLEPKPEGQTLWNGPFFRHYKNYWKQSYHRVKFCFETQQGEICADYLNRVSNDWFAHTYILLTELEDNFTKESLNKNFPNISLPPLSIEPLNYLKETSPQQAWIQLFRRHVDARIKRVSDYIRDSEAIRSKFKDDLTELHKVLKKANEEKKAEIREYPFLIIQLQKKYSDKIASEEQQLLEQKYTVVITDSNLSKSKLHIKFPGYFKNPRYKILKQGLTYSITVKKPRQHKKSYMDAQVKICREAYCAESGFQYPFFFWASTIYSSIK